MPTYVTLANWTEQGVRTAKDTVARYRAADPFPQPTSRNADCGCR